MTISLRALRIAACVVIATPSAAQANHHEVAKEAALSAQSSVPGWQDMIDAMQSLPDRMLAKLPEDMRGDPQVQQEVARLALAAMTSSAIGAIGADGDHPQFLPVLGQVFNVGQPNADTVYRSATITPRGVYRLRGKQGTVNHAIIAQFLAPSAQAGGSRPHLKLSDVPADADGRFDILISETKPEGYEGEWWELHPAATRLMIRMVSTDWSGEVEPTLSIERLDIAPERPRPSAEKLEAALRGFVQGSEFMALMFVDHHEKLRAEGYINSVKAYDVGMGALDGQFYYEGAYDLGDDEALIVESDVPKTCMYRSLILTNELYETTDWYNNHSSLNKAQAAPDPDGKLRIVISARDPGVKNWLDTAGHPRGVIQGRWTGCDSQPMPTVTRVPLADLRKHLPADVATVTREEREAIIRERRRALLERPLW